MLSRFRTYWIRFFVKTILCIKKALRIFCYNCFNCSYRENQSTSTRIFLVFHENFQISILKSVTPNLIAFLVLSGIEIFSITVICSLVTLTKYLADILKFSTLTRSSCGRLLWRDRTQSLTNYSVRIFIITWAITLTQNTAFTLREKLKLNETKSNKILVTSFLFEVYKPQAKVIQMSQVLYLFI